MGLDQRVFSEYRQQLSRCMASDQHRLETGLRKLQSLQAANKPYDKSFVKFKQQLQASISKCEQRSASIPDLHFPENLPIVARQDDILEAIRTHQVVVIAGETGSGKTTQLPKLCLKAGLGTRGLIGHTQPRRLAARAVATRIADELKVPLGQQVGYQVRFTDRVSENTHIKLMTDGILLAETQSDPYFTRYDTIIIDEAHERSLNIDFLVGYLKRILPKRPDLKVIITSATIDLERFSKHFNNAPIIEVSGRTFPVEVLYRPNADNDSDDGDPVVQGVINAMDEIIAWERKQKKTISGDVLVFLSGEKDIRMVAKALRDQVFPHTEILPLYARLSNAEQNKVFQSHSGRRVVLATNVAETSLTVPGIRYVIDPGFARISRYSYRSKVQSLPIEAVSRASAEQRKGRCGRVADGVCIRLYAEDDFNARDEFTTPEISRTNLASVILQMVSLKLGDIEEFPFIDKPDSRFIKDGLRLLQELGAVDQGGKITDTGQLLSQLPVDPKIGRMLLAANKEKSLKEVLVIASALGIQDPRERPHDKQQASDEKHRRFKDKESDYISLINHWNYWEEQRQELTQNQLRKLGKKEFISFMRMREWREVHHQLRIACQQLGLKENTAPASYFSVHRALLTGLLGNIGLKAEDREYLGARNKRLSIFPGSGLYKKQPKWVMAAELVETSKIYARVVAKIEPEWIEQVAGALVKRSYSEPHWEKKQAQVMAYERVTVYGLVTTTKRRVHYGNIDSVVSREIFIRSALVEGDYKTRAACIAKNRDLIEEVSELESKARARDILIDDEFLYSFYEERIPSHILNGAGFDSWYKKNKDQDVLLLTKEALMRRDADEVSVAQYPEILSIEGMSFMLDYHFEPGDSADGVTIVVPIVVINQLPEQRLQWLVPGMLRDKCIALIKTLPKQLRKNFVPVPDYVDAMLSKVVIGKGALSDVIAESLLSMTGINIAREDWRLDQLDAHHFFNIKVLDEQGGIVAEGRNLAELREQFSNYEVKLVQPSEHERAIERSNMQHWDLDTLPEVVEVNHGGINIKRYPALIDIGKSVDIKLVSSSEEAYQYSVKGSVRLLRLALATELKYFKKKIPKLNETSLLFASAIKKEVLVEDILDAIIKHAAYPQEFVIPRTQAEFETIVSGCKDRLELQTQVIGELVHQIADLQNKARKPLKGKISLEWATAYNDIKTQLSALAYPGFVAETSHECLRQIPRYLMAISHRLDKLGGQLNKDRQYTIELSSYWEKYIGVANSQKEQGLPLGDAAISYRWMIEEYRVSLFAQSLGTHVPISSKRLNKQWALVQASLGLI